VQLSDIVAAHESCSKQHAALQFREVNGAIRPYLIDVGSANGTFVNKQRIKPNEFVPATLARSR
jgi:smad nuclear-interacting protein 1